MKMRFWLSWFTATLLCSLSVTRDLNAGMINFSPMVVAHGVETSGDVGLLGSTGPIVSLLNDGFTLSRSYTLNAINNNGSGTGFWRADREFDAIVNTDVSVRIKGDTVVSFATGSVLFTVSATVFDVNSGKVTTSPVFQSNLTPGMTQVSWNDTSIIKGILKSAEPFDDTLVVQSSVLWTGFKPADVLTVGSLYSVTMDAVPEPASWLLLSTSLLGLLGHRWRRRKHGESVSH